MISAEHQHVVGGDGVRVHVARVGQGPLILFVHGFPEFWGAWHRQLQAFSEDHLAAAVDQRGYNLSDKPRQSRRYALLNLAEDLRRVIETLSPHAPAVVVGHDWGGLAAWTLAREHPERVERLVILNAPLPSLLRRELRHNGRQWLASSYAAAFQLPVVTEASLRAFGFAGLRAMLFGSTTKPERFTPALRAAYLEAWRQPEALRSMLLYYRSAPNLREVLTKGTDWRISVPTLVLWGDRDPALRVENLNGLQECVPDVRIVRHPTATHWIVHEESEWVNQQIRSFLAEPRHRA